MLKLLKQIRRKLLDEGNLKRYLIYASGEILLVMIGILLALQVNNWNEARKAGIKEIESLKELETNLDKNIESLQKSIDFQNFSINGINQIISHLLNPSNVFTDSLLSYYKYSTWYEQISISSSAYESLKNNGFEIIRDKDIKNKIIELFEVIYSTQVNASNAVSPVFGLAAAQLAIEKDHLITKILSTNNFKEDDTYHQLLNFMRQKKIWKNDFLNGQQGLLEETIKLKTEIANYLNK
ncbi:MAG: DUF6090 family protein [Saprospiraceae bacterium]